MKKCPKCRVELKTKVLGSIEVDECESCKGVWLEKGELEEVKDETDPNLDWLDFEIWKHPEKFKSSSTGVDCPVCGTTTASLEYGDTGVEINYCGTCQGIWLDKDELPKIIESLEDEISRKTLADYFKESVEEAKEIVTGHESFMSEWKDFSSVLKLMQYRLFVEKPKLVETLTELNTLNPFK
ncbi:MAG: zf-TFIIB domain-containing protein [Candidatus Dadabacteria bacterium]